MSYRRSFWIVPFFFFLLSACSCSLLKITTTEANNAPSNSAKATSPPVLIPRPKFVTFDKEAKSFLLTADTVIVVSDKPAQNELFAAALLRREAASRFHLSIPQINESALQKSRAKNLILLAVGWVPDSLRKLSPAMLKSPLAVPQKPEGYTLRVAPGLVIVSGYDARGVFWGTQTLLQLFSSVGSGSATAPAVSIRDWPSLSLRAVHLFHGHNALPFHEKLIERIFSRYKLNAVFVEAEQVRWDHDSSVAPGWAGSRAQLKEEINFARQRGVTVYPLLQSYGHLAWLLDNSRNRELAEDPATPYALNYSNPKAVTYMDGFNGEADTLFNAPGFHVGLDEVALRGRFPFRSKPKPFSQIYVQAATHWDNFFQKRGKPVFMWADQALSAVEENPDFGTASSAAEAKAVRDGLPKDIILMDWQYGERTDFPSLRRLKEAGFKNVVAATWYRPKNIQNFARAASEVGAMGAIQTTWAGYNSEESVLDSKDRQQFIAMVLAAEYFWNGGEGPLPDKLPYDPGKVFMENWRANP